MRRQCLKDGLGPDGQVSYPHSDRLVYRVADGRGDRNHSGLAQADGKFLAVDKLDIHLWYVLHAQRSVGIKVGILDSPLFKGGALVQCHAQAPQG